MSLNPFKFFGQRKRELSDLRDKTQLSEAEMSLQKIGFDFFHPKGKEVGLMAHNSIPGYEFSDLILKPNLWGHISDLVRKHIALAIDGVGKFNESAVNSALGRESTPVIDDDYREKINTGVQHFHNDATNGDITLLYKPQGESVNLPTIVLDPKYDDLSLERYNQNLGNNNFFKQYPWALLHVWIKSRQQLLFFRNSNKQRFLHAASKTPINNSSGSLPENIGGIHIFRLDSKKNYSSADVSES